MKSVLTQVRIKNMHPIRKDFDLNKLTEVDLDISDLKISYKIWKERNNTGLFLQITGNYRDGSQGEPDAIFIQWKIREILDHPDLYVKGLVYDLTEFHYQWGDNISINPQNRTIPFLVYLTEDQADAFSYFVDREKMRFHLKTALAEINDEMKE